MAYRYRRVLDTIRRFPWEQKEHSNLDSTKGPYTKMKSKASTKLGQKSGLLPQNRSGSGQGQMDRALQNHSMIFLGDIKLGRKGRLWIRRKNREDKQHCHWC